MSDELELALARLAWARAAAGAQLPSQREALEWHVARSEAARAAMDAVRDEGPDQAQA